MIFATSIWKEQREVESFEVDMNGRLRAHFLFAFLLNAAWNHAEAFEFDHRALSARNLMWVLSKLQLSIHTLPAWGEKIIVETWGKRIERFYALRDFVVSEAGGEKLCSATSAWMILDKSSYRPQRLEVLMKDFPWTPERNEIETDLKKIPEPATENTCSQCDVLFSDIDVNKHVTATRYLQWIIDSSPHQLLTEDELKYVEISFLAQAVLGDRISVCREGKAEGDLCRIRRLTDNQELCRARLEWRGAHA